MGKKEQLTFQKGHLIFGGGASITEVNIITATTGAVASTALGVPSSVPEPVNTAVTEDSVSTTISC